MILKDETINKILVTRQNIAASRLKKVVMLEGQEEIKGVIKSYKQNM